MQGEKRTILFYEAPHKLPGTLRDLCEAFGPDRPLTIARELTKLHEEIRPTTLGEAAAYYAENTPRGEFVLVMGGAPDEPEAAPATPEDGAALARRLMEEEGLSPAAAAKEAAGRTGANRRQIYKALLEGEEETE